MTVFAQVLDRMQELGMYLMYEISGYRSSTAVTEQVNALKDRPNLLLWCTADEPDGISAPLDATTKAYALVYGLDGYHLVSVVLNCQDYYWIDYAAGTDIIVHDVYMIGNNVSYSNQWNTVCTPDYGDCGCDSCVSIPAGDSAVVPPNLTLLAGPVLAGPVLANNGIGSYFNIANRGSSFEDKLDVMGWRRSKAIWTVPQAFGGAR